MKKQKQLDKEIGGIVKALIVRSKNNQKEIAQLLKISPASLSQMLSGVAPLPLDKREKICNLLNVSEGDIGVLNKLQHQKTIRQLKDENIYENTLEDHYINREHFNADVAHFVREKRFAVNQNEEYKNQLFETTSKDADERSYLEQSTEQNYMEIEQIDTQIYERTIQAKTRRAREIKFELKQLDLFPNEYNYSQKDMLEKELRYIQRTPLFFSKAKIATDFSMFKAVKLASKAATKKQGNVFIPTTDGIGIDDEYIYFPHAKETDFSIEITDDSMSPWYPEGTFILASTEQMPVTGDRVIVQNEDGKILFKVFIDEGKSVRLMSINRNNGDDIVLSKRSPVKIYPIKQSIRDEQKLDEHMEEADIKYFWEK